MNSIDLPKNDRRDHLINLLKAAFATAPFTGGVASLLGDYIPSSRQKRIEALLLQVFSDVEKLQISLSDELWSSDEFAFALEQCMRGVAENHRADKMEVFRGILLNSIVDHSESSSVSREYMIDLATRLSSLHILILSFLASPPSYLAAQNISESEMRGGFSTFFPVAIPNTDLDLIISAFGELYDLGMVGTPKSVFHTMTSAEGLNLLGDRLTEFGKEFIRFCSVPGD